MSIPDNEFAKMHNAATSAKALADKLGISEQAVSMRARKLRAKGVELKTFPRGGKRAGSGRKALYTRKMLQAAFANDAEKAAYEAMTPRERVVNALRGARHG